MIQILAEWHFKPGLEAAREMREALEPVLQASHVENAAPFQLACAELIVNLNNYPEPRPQNACLRFGKDEWFWWLELLDDGGSFNSFARHVDNQDPLEALEGGMGLRLLTTLFDDIVYQPACFRDDGMNRMALRLPQAQTEPDLPTLLVVDDDTVYRQIICHFLQPAYRVIQAANMHEALLQAERYRPELVICDIKMPDGDGLELYDQLDRRGALHNVAFIYLSGTQDPEVIRQVVSRPVDEFLHKPVRREQLLDVVARVRSRRKHLLEQLEAELSERMTLGLQPSLPEQLPGFRCAVRHRCPEAGGGDLLLARDRLLIMADLMGHGARAKGFAYALAGYLRGLCAGLHPQGLDPQTLIQALSSGFAEDPLLSRTLATLLVVELRGQGELVLVNAGSPLPWLISTEQASAVVVEGALPGLSQQAYQERHLQLSAGQRLLIFSDGFLDAGEAMPQELQQRLLESARMQLPRAADHLMRALEGRHVQDDVTLILLEPVTDPD